MNYYRNPFIDNSAFKVNITNISYDVKYDDATNIDYNNCVIYINRNLNIKLQLVELLKAFYELIFKNYHIDYDDSTKAILAHNTLDCFNNNYFYMEDNKYYPSNFKLGNVNYKVIDVDLDFDNLIPEDRIHYGMIDYVTSTIYITNVSKKSVIPFDKKTATFWHEFVHALLDISNSQFNEEFIVDNISKCLLTFMTSFKSDKV